MNKTYCFDLDGTLCTQTYDGKYEDAQPIEKAIKEVNRLFESGCKIIIDTGRGSSSGIDWKDVTVRQLRSWNLKYHELHVGRKISADIFVDDRSINANDWLARIKE
jgi:hypothetical protein